MIEDIFLDLASQIGIEKVRRSVISEQIEAENEKARISTQQWMMSIIAESADKHAEYSCSIVECDRWFVPVNGDGSYELIDSKPGWFDLAIDPNPKSVKGKKHGKGGKLLPLYINKPEKKECVEIDGRALVRSLPKKFDGFLLHLRDQPALELPEEDFRDLDSLVEMCELEDLLRYPANDQIDALLEATYQLELTDDGTPSTYSPLNCRSLALVHTHRYKAGWSSGTLKPIKGRELFKLISESAKVNGILVNQIHQTGRGPIKLNHLMLSIGFADRILKGEDIRPGANPLPLRSVDEIDLWLDMRKFPTEGRKIIDAELDDVILYRAVVPQGSGWSMQEAGGQKETEGPTWSPVFALSKTNPIPLSEASRIICPGYFAEKLGADILIGGSNPKRFNPGTNYLIGRKLYDWEVQDAKLRVMWATELLKFLPPGAETIPKTSYITCQGASIAHEFPHAGQRAWIEGSLAQAQRFCKKWLWFNA